jgi:hypothetical protein
MILADMVWPSLYLEHRVATWWAIIIGIVVELFFVWKYFSLPIKKAILATLVMNAASALMGYVLIPASGLLWELTIGQFVNWALRAGTFNIVTWCASVILAILLNSIIEALVLRFAFKCAMDRKRFLILFGANSISVVIAFVSLVIFPLQL